ncbi:hypothetical protein [Aliikangiella sp. IMCC44359]|uniref:hypothetical protein n=1 Tax=Aliikangiella sp. IMCC44359 TaxID=3459125 RepID=UPI00403AA4C3
MEDNNVVIHLFLKSKTQSSIAGSTDFPEFENLLDFVPSEESFNKVIKKLNQLGIKALKSGVSTLRLEASKSTIEAVFSCRIEKNKDGSFKLTTPATIPVSLSNWVDTIDFAPGHEFY